jgi:hypothetical protein
VDDLHRLLELVRRDLGADDVRAEVGGRDPESERVVWAALSPGWRVVATFDQPPANLDEKRERLQVLVEPFEHGTGKIEVPSGGLGIAKQHALDEELDALAERTGARAAVVFDERSPVLWGSSGPRARAWDLDSMERVRSLATEMSGEGIDAARWLGDETPDLEGVDETLAQRWMHRIHRFKDIAPEWKRSEWHDALQVAIAVSIARAECRGGRAPDRVCAHEGDWGVFARGFAQIYLVALVYDGAFSELHAEGPLVRALPHIETLVLALPPVEPPPRAANVISLRRRR